MLYLVGGAPRAGKGTLALRMVREHGIPYVSLDLIRDVFHWGVPELGISHGQKTLEQAALMWPRISFAICSLRDMPANQLVEGIYLLPEYLAECRDFFGACARMCWIGYADADPEEKFRVMRQLPSETNDWVKWKDDDKVKSGITEAIEFSCYLRDECAKYGLRYFDTSHDFNLQIESARSFLLET